LQPEDYHAGHLGLTEGEQFTETQILRQHEVSLASGFFDNLMESRPTLV